MSKDKKFYILRHGETFATKRGIGYGVRIFSAPLLPEARRAIERMANYLKDIPTDYHVSSRIKRCRQTAQIITEITGKEFAFDARLNEYFIETFGHFRKRIQSFLDEMQSSEYKNIVICTHGAGIAGLVSLITKTNFDRYTLFNYPPPGILTIIEKEKLQQINFNKPQDDANE